MRKYLISVFLLLISAATLYSQDGLGVWTVTYNNTSRIYAIVINPVNQNIMYTGSLDSGVYKTTNGGLNWTPVNNGLTYVKVQCLAISSSNPNVLYAGTDHLGTTNSGIYVSTDAGANWTYKSTGITDVKGIQQIVIHPTNPNLAFAAVFDGVNASTIGMYKTTDGGNTWTASNTGMTNYNILSIAFNPLNPNVMYAGSSLILPGSTGPAKIYKSYNGGANWFEIVNGLPTGTTTGNPVRALSVSTTDTSRVLAALFVNDTTGGVYVTTNSGQLWQKKYSALPNTVGTLYRACLIRPGSSAEMYVCIDRTTPAAPMGVYRSTDGGNIWADFNGGSLLNSYSIRAFAFKTLGPAGDPTLYAGGSHTTLPTARGVFEYSWIGTGIVNNGQVPEKFYLSQNYPNPFNPSATIEFGMQKTGFVSIKVFDMLGREVAVLVNEVRKAGIYTAVFDGSKLTSGAYFYRIETNGFTDTKRMLLIK
ncbi:MAG: T9SS type A sorting domain-containing protein [Ignavibacteria bacterium]|jgi:photosystem II stability/assembly factor-like uncharacterized protein|nr:T9SS type A sorting domain-containing protein [Ignavibacteria bacterium]